MPPQKLVMNRLVIWVVLFCSTIGYAQQDSLYYQKQNKKENIYLNATVYRNLFGLVLKNKSQNTYFLPNQIGSVSVGVSHPKLPIAISAGIGMGKVDKDFPKTTSYDFLIHQYGKHFVADAFLQYYKGFYIDHYDGIHFDSEMNKAQRSYPNLRKILVGAFGQYVFNGNKFSYQSAFDNTKEKQLKSAGSALAGVSVYYFNLDSDKPIIADLKNVKQWQFGLNGGYSYNFVIAKKWLLNLSATAGLNFDEKWKMKPTGQVRASCFYTHENWSVGASAFTNILTVINQDDILGTLNSGAVNLSLIHRFKIKKKHGWY